MTIFEIILYATYKERFQIPVRFRWTPDEPYIVKLTFMERGAEEVTWDIGREFLMVGLIQKNGTQDVILTPCGSKVSMLLSVKGHETAVDFNIRDVAQFLEATLHVVAHGDEFTRVDWDEEAKQLLE